MTNCVKFFLGSLHLQPDTLLGLRINSKLSLKNSNPSSCTILLFDRLDALLLMQFPNLHLLFFGPLGYFLHSIFEFQS